MKTRKRFSIVITTVMILSLVLAGGAAAKSAGKTEVCHNNGNGSYSLLKIKANTLQTHLAHGDAAPGAAVPGKAGMLFAANCSLVSTGQNGQVQTLTVPSNTNNGKKATKVDVCHRTGNGSFILININSNALPAHLQHGDVLPNEALANQSGKFSNPACPTNQVPREELFDSFTVPATPAEGEAFPLEDSKVLVLDQLYEIRVSGTYKYNNTFGDWADAEYFHHGVDDVIKGDDDPRYSLHPNILDLTITPDPASCSANTDWGVYNGLHEYTKQVTGENKPLYFCIYDDPYTDNAGSLNVEIWKINR